MITIETVEQARAELCDPDNIDQHHLAQAVELVLARLDEAERLARREHQRAENLRAAFRESTHQVYGLRRIARREATYQRIQNVGQAMTRALGADLDLVRGETSWDSSPEREHHRAA